MLKYSEMEKQILQAQKPQVRTVKCDKCDSEFFEQVSGSKFNADQTVSVGQRLAPQETYHFLRCVRCQEVYEPLVQYNGASQEGRAYDVFRDTMDGKNDKRGKDKP